MNPRIFWLVLCGALSPASADIYRCAGPVGPVYQDRPCTGAGERVPMEHRAPRAEARPGIRDSERRWLAERRCWQRRQRLEAVRRHLRRGYRPLEGDRLRHEARRLEDYLFRFCD